MSQALADLRSYDVLVILNEMKEGKSKRYNLLLNQFSNPQTSPQFYMAALQGLKDCVSVLRQEFDAVVGTLLKMDWLKQTAEVITLYKALILDLIAAHTYYLNPCLRMIVLSFTPKILPSDIDKIQGDHIRTANEQAFLHLHDLLQSLSKIVPMATRALIPLMAECQPYLKKSAYQQECYFRNLLKITGYAPTLRSTVLTIIIDRLMKLDVCASREAIQEAEENTTEAQMFAMDLNEEKIVEVKPMQHAEADRLDQIMHLLLYYIHFVCYEKDELKWTECKTIFRELLTVFDKIVVKTYASSHTQFFMFYICSFNDLLVEGFLDYLWKRVQNPSHGMVFRQASVAYMASFIARAKYVNGSSVTACLDLLVAWIHNYIKNSSDSVKVDIEHHGTFYSVCQALFYILVFRHKELLASSKGVKRVQGFNLQTIVTCRLNPLKFCLPIIANTFVSIARIHQLAFCDTVMEKNRRQHLPIAAQDKMMQHNPLDSFFPFDPYILTRSKDFITELYQEFEGNVMEEGHEGMEDEELDLYEHKESASVAMALSASSLPKSPPDFMMYGTSPGFHHP
ncbi:hypothetical protein CAPTEDRAFT_221291 [Capitella teleta]|uniref:RNA polymerase I-specific transcription initiation factor RRN3 n=1 Tax=Capitella teleta TaxID=283909 RepID=R7TLI9_CAPTE|nr:hypothetical protein CAPTEDRAFT_221291 [Capitella teleta]|eukprot:ELT94357.1 hypothetical protein CAPTEDRAFT_221291 [Capitella teleta]